VRVECQFFHSDRSIERVRYVCGSRRREFHGGRQRDSQKYGWRKSWTALKNGLPPNSSYGRLVIDRAAPSTIYGSYVVTGCGGCGGIIKTNDGGAHWTIIKSSLTEGDTHTFAIDPTVQGTKRLFFLKELLQPSTAGKADALPDAIITNLVYSPDSLIFTV
jgi:hypothetical protein